MKTIVIVPACNSAESLRGLLPRIRSYLDDIVVVDDGSSDKTANTASELGAHVIKHDNNLGKGAALKTGFAYVLENGFDTVITIDSDSQHDPDDIPRFIQAYNQSGADMIIGSRKHEKNGMPWGRRFSNWSTSRFLSFILTKEIEDSQCGYRLISGKLLKSISLVSNRFELESEIIIKAVRSGFGIEFLPIKVDYFKARKSHMRPFADTIRWCRAVLKLIR